MEGTESAADVAPPAKGVGRERNDVDANDCGTSSTGQDGQQQCRSASFSSAGGGGKEDAFEEEETTHPPPLTPSFSGADSAPLEAPIYEMPPLAERGSQIRGASASIEAPASADVLNEVGECVFASSTSNSLNGACAPPYQDASRAPIPLYFVEGTHRSATGPAPAGENAADEGGSLDRLFVSSVPTPQGKRPHLYSPPSSARGRDDIIEFVVQKPTSGRAVVPYFFAKNRGLTCAAPLTGPLFREAALVDMEGYACVPATEAMRTADYFQLQQQRLQEQHQQQDQLLQDKQGNMYVSSPSGVSVLLPFPEWQTPKSLERNFSAGNEFPLSCAAASFAPSKAEAAAPLYPTEFGPPSYSLRPVWTPEGGIMRDVRSFVLVPQNSSVEMRRKAQELDRDLFSENSVVAVIQRGWRGSRLLFPPRTPHRVEKGDKVVVPNAKRLLCFGHAGDERKFCFGLLQLPPPPLKYDFLIEKKAVYCGMCENVKYVAVCRKCRMRLPNCPYCDKQSAIRHP